MKSLIAVLLVISITTCFAQTNYYPDTGDVLIKTGKLYIETPTAERITIKELRYDPNIFSYHIATQSDGLQIWQDNNLNYQFKLGGDFLVNRGKVGIGSYSPIGKLHIETAGGINNSTENLLTFRDTRYTPYMVFNFTTESDGLQIRQDNTINYQFKNDGNFIVNNGSVGIGTTDLTPNAKLTVAGLVHAREVKVSVDAGADFVFESDYDLKSLEQLEVFIKTNKHLPDMAPAFDMVKNGINLGEMEIKLLQKIEELTLYMLDFKKQMRLLEYQNNQLKDELDALKKRDSISSIVRFPK